MAELSSALQNPQALITLGVLGLAVVLFITGLIAPELTGLLSLSLLIATGVLNPQEALAGFGSPALITLLGLFPVSAALFKSGALDRLRDLIASERIRSSRRLIALMAFVIAPVSGMFPTPPWWPRFCPWWRGGANGAVFRHPGCSCPCRFPPCLGAPSPCWAAR